MQGNNKYLEIRKYGTEEVVKRIDVTTQSHNIHKIERGMNINLNHTDYYTVERKSESILPEI